jgi:hypothetical protein
MSVLRAIVAVAALIFFAAFCVFLLANAGTDSSSEWERWVYVFGGVEAIAFAGVGWLFGKEVNRQRAQSAEEQAEQASAKAEAEAAKGHQLAGLVLGAQGGLEVQGVSAQASQAARFAREHYDLG